MDNQRGILTDVSYVKLNTHGAGSGRYRVKAVCSQTNTIWERRGKRNKMIYMHRVVVVFLLVFLFSPPNRPFIEYELHSDSIFYHVSCLVFSLFLSFFLSLSAAVFIFSFLLFFVLISSFFSFFFLFFFFRYFFSIGVFCCCCCCFVLISFDFLK